MRVLTLLTVAISAAAQVIHHGAHPAGLQPAQVLARQESKCAELPALCTAPVMMHGAMTTMTYLCPPKMTDAPGTQTTTVTKTTTVTVGQSKSVEMSKLVDNDTFSYLEARSNQWRLPIPEVTESESTSTTTIFWTSTRYLTITVHRVTPTASPQVHSPSTSNPVLSKPVISTSKVSSLSPTSTAFSSSTSSSFVITSLESSSSSVSTLFPSISVTVYYPPPGNHSRLSHLPSVISQASQSSLPCPSGVSCFLIGSHSTNATTSSQASSKTSWSSTKLLPTPHTPVPVFPNSTSSASGYHMPTFIIGRGINATQPAIPSATNESGRKSVSLAALFIGLMAFAYLA